MISIWADRPLVFLQDQVLYVTNLVDRHADPSQKTTEISRINCPTRASYLGSHHPSRGWTNSCVFLREQQYTLKLLTL